MICLDYCKKSYNFVNDELSSFTLETAAKYTRILKKIDLLEQLEKDFRKNNILKDSLNLEQSEKSQGKDRSHEVSLEGIALFIILRTR